MSDLETPNDPILPPPPPPAAPSPPPEPAETHARPKRRRGMIVGAVALVMALLAGALAFVFTRGGNEAEALPLGLAFTKGQTQTYVIGMTMDGKVDAASLGSQSITMDVSETVTWTVTDVDSDGVATIEVAITDMSGSVDGTELPSTGAELPSVTMEITPDGRILTAGGLALGGIEQTQGFGFPGMGQMTPLLPDGEVAPGDTWTKTFTQENPFGGGSLEFTATSTFEGYEDVNGAQAAVVTTSYDVPMDFTIDLADLLQTIAGSSGSDELSGLTGIGDLVDASITYGGQGSIDMKSWIDTEAHQMLKMHSSGDFDMTMEFTGIPTLEGRMGFTGTFTESIELQ